ncbi:3-hydroxyacyl-CoA dehydrogenase [Desulfosporosinus orientis DSM 765]|uniref:3-hydroxybutyryl-CoA dehydrogenase n=1 Tax=Desulfosporosinus orientis (strain ATCC 19365 / DSM 765 / NCIMB 8382 / VKM B-1628 / Singapore I) TaxID=768706 RepID=G7WID5_DESOD|nr:3-hydroxyacyl-CoA dehydrogenase family protein [Desulfosporosinus orientis]AET68583.1 3-hydroxyacyl-CoA dehydrogenase [Desulfosporosinus orientis DSM 765]
MINIGVIGAGAMGSGIAQVAAEAGYGVLIFDVDPNASEKALGKLQKNWQKAVDKEKINPEEMQKRVALVRVASDLADLKDFDLVIEAVAENQEVKKSVFSRLDEVCTEKTIFASNTSSLSITEIGSFTNRPDKVAGMHFFNPVPVMKLIEIIKGLATSEETIDALKVVAAKMKKVGVVANDTPGFIVNRLLVPLCNEAIKMLEAGVASLEDIDTAMKLGANWPMGPFELSDLVGLDVHIGATAGLERELNDSHYACARLARQMYRANRLGRKTGKGFYDYNK